MRVNSDKFGRADRSAGAKGSSAAWWDEVRATSVLALPLVLTQLAVIAIHTTDVLMMGWLGPQALAAGTLASSFYTPFFFFGLGLLTAVAPICAQALGGGGPGSTGRSAARFVRGFGWRFLWSFLSAS